MDRKVIVEKYAETEEKMFMTIDEAIQLSHELAIRIAARGENPELIVGVANGALLVTKIVSDDLNIPMQIIKIKRKATTAKEFIAKRPILLKIISVCYRFPVLHKPMEWLINRFKMLDVEDYSEEVCNQAHKKNIVVVDDAVETGQTLAMVCQMFNCNASKIVTTAVISWSKKYDSDAQNGIVPNIYIGRRIQHFPWSGNSPYLQEYLQWLAANNLKTE